MAIALVLPLFTYTAAHYTSIGLRLNNAARVEFIGTGFDSYDAQALIFLIAPGLIPLLFLSYSEIAKALVALSYTLALTAYVGFIYLGWPLHPGKIINPSDARFNPHAFSFEDYPMTGDINHYALFFTLRHILKDGMAEQDVDDILVVSGGAHKSCRLVQPDQPVTCAYAYMPLGARFKLPGSLASSGYMVYVYYDKDRYLTDMSINTPQQP